MEAAARVVGSGALTFSPRITRWICQTLPSPDEAELAVRTFDTGHCAMRILALARLAELRVSQGREAEELLAG